jgi:hypothetical protein
LAQGDTNAAFNAGHQVQGHASAYRYIGDHQTA